MIINELFEGLFNTAPQFCLIINPCNYKFGTFVYKFIINLLKNVNCIWSM